MSHGMDPQTFSDLLDRSFGDEPAHPPVAADLRAGRRRLRRRRTGAALAALVVVGALGASYAVLAPGRGDGAPVADDLTDAQVVARCLDSRVSDSWQRGGMTRAELGSVMGRGELMTRARSTYDVLATIRSEDGRSWLWCTLPQSSRSRESRRVAAYRTDVAYPSRVVDGRRVYEPAAESDPRVAAASSSAAPGWNVDCFPRGLPEESHAFFVASARCATFSVVWQDRRPADVARARIVNPDGTVGWADVRDGYLSYAYSAPMTPALRRAVAAQDVVNGPIIGIVRDVRFYDAQGRRIASGPDYRAGRSAPSIADYPSLAITLKADQRP